MKILIVSGFLGAGKTTFIKELVRRSGTRPVIMENEYGETDLDALELDRSLSEQKEMKILEFMEGCVCCTKKDSFVNSVLTVFSGLDPEYLVIEPTGVGRLSNILKNLKPILHDRIRLLQPVVVLSPRTYRSNMAEWPELYRDQIAHAGIVVFSKGEREDPALLEDTAARIREINPEAEILTQHYSLQPDSWWHRCMELSAKTGDMKDELEGGEEFSQLSLRTARLDRPAELILFLEDCLRGELGHIVRAKGVLPVGGEMLRFDLADRQYAITGAEEEKSQCVIIGTELPRQELFRRLGTSAEEEALRLSWRGLKQ
ncbi:MAG: GTP-binding protein [Lachnospiraceae bacterium]|nr:GTP-binding protein [Lachnospiraceae bacterium]